MLPRSRSGSPSPMNDGNPAPDAARAPKLSFVSLGCPKALVDSERIITRLRAEGYELSRQHEGAEGPRGRGPTLQIPTPRANPEPRTENLEPRTPEPRTRTKNPEPRTKNYEPRTTNDNPQTVTSPTSS